MADEPVSMLDVSIRLDILRLLARLRQEVNLEVLYITHDLATARHFSDDILVLLKGRVVERGPADDAILDPRHPYRKILAAAAPDPLARHRPDDIGPDAVTAAGTAAAYDHYTDSGEDDPAAATRDPAHHHRGRPRTHRHGLVVEVGRGASTGGKRRTLLQLNPEGRYAVGVLFERNICVIVVVDLAGQQVARTSFPGTALLPPEKALPLVASRVNALLETASVDRDRVLGVGLVSYGPQERQSGVLLTHQPTDAWQLRMPGELRRSHGGHPTGHADLGPRPATRARSARRRRHDELRPDRDRRRCR